MATPHDIAGWEVVHAATRHAARRLGERLASSYAIGSLAHGGFTPAVSDVDLALLTAAPEPEMATLAAELVADVRRTYELGERLSVFHCSWDAFGDPPRTARFPPIDRFDLVRHGILVHGSDMRATHAVVPTAEEIRAHAVDFALQRITPRQIGRDLAALRSSGTTVHDATKLVLWPVRLQHVCDTGEATGNAGAVAHYLTLSDAAHRSLARDALAWRDHATLPDPVDALTRITREIPPMHAEVLARLGDRPDIPRHRELADRAGQILTGN